MRFAGTSAIEKIFILLVLTAGIILLSSQPKSGQAEFLQKPDGITDGWYYIDNDQRIDVQLPADITAEAGDDLVLYCDSLTKQNAGQLVTTRGALYHINISLDNHTLYSYDDTSFPRNDQMSSKVNCTAALPSSYDGEPLAFTYHNTGNNTFHIKEVYIGDTLPLFLYHCSRDAGTLIIVFVIAILAVITVCISLYLKYMNVHEKRFADISVFLLLCACWFLTDSSTAQLFSGPSAIIRYVSFYAFMLLAIPMLHFIKNTSGMNQYRIVDIISYLFYGNAIIQSVLNYLGIFDFIDMLFVTHLLLFGGSLTIMLLLLKVYKKDPSGELRSILAAFAVVAGGGVLSLILYWLLKLSYYELLFELGIVAFIILLIQMLINTMVQNMRFKTEAEVYERLSKEDPMTGLKNRRAFNEEIERIEGILDSYSSLYLIFMDVNRLKDINDNYGHSTGDELILATAGCIYKAYGSLGPCFRIGGDEFCAVLPDTDLSEQQLSQLLDKELALYNSMNDKLRLTLAKGISDIRDDDGNLKTVSDWKKDADLKMYRDKGWVKYSKEGVQ